MEIAVQDTGIGMKAGDLPQLFQAFTQLYSTSEKQYQGTGLGLALTKWLVELHGGSIRAESPGQGLGSTFTIWLPMIPPDTTSGRRGHNEASSPPHLSA